MNINHDPLLNTNFVEEYYSRVDGVPVTYVCTSALDVNAVYAADIFYRETPHPVYGNRYFGLYQNSDKQVMITNADRIEDLAFSMIEGDAGWEYSQHRWDYRQVGQTTIDGGRSYTKLGGNIHTPVKVMKVKDGVFVDVEL